MCPCSHPATAHECSYPCSKSNWPRAGSHRLPGSAPLTDCDDGQIRLYRLTSETLAQRLIYGNRHPSVLSR